MLKQAITKHKFLAVILVVLFIIGFALVVPPKNHKKDIQPTSKIVKTYTIIALQPMNKRTFSGRIQSADQVDLAFEVPGKLIELAVKEGELVDKDHVIARLDPRDFQNQLNQEQARNHELKAQYQRAQELIKKNVISQADFDKIKSEYDISHNRVAIAKKSLDDAILKAPFSGQIAKRFVKNHQTIQAKQVIVSLQNQHNLEVHIDVPERILPNAQGSEKNYDFYAVFDALPQRKIPLEFKSFGTQSDPHLLTYPITFLLPVSLESEIRVFPGMIVNVIVQTKPSLEQKNTLYIPLSAIIAEQHKQYVWIINPQNQTVSKRYIKTQNLKEDLIEVSDGLQLGEVIVAAGGQSLKEGMTIKPYTPHSQLR